LLSDAAAAIIQGFSVVSAVAILDAGISIDIHLFHFQLAAALHGYTERDIKTVISKV